MTAADDDIGTANTELAALPRREPAPVAASSRLEPGDVVGGYVIEGFCGAGGMGVVYRGRDRLLGREVAVKLVSSERAGTSRCGVMCSLLVREAQTLSRLSHPNLLGVYSIGEHRQCVYVAMEFIDGVTLGLWSRGRPWRERLEALLAAGRGLAAAHAGGVHHRDFKPDNVMVKQDGQVKVMDFGLARSAAELDAAPSVGSCASCAPPEQVARLLDPNAVVGTPRYMAPEQFESAGADARSDQYAYAVSCWEVLYERAPHAGDTPAQLYLARTSAELPSAPAGDVPEGVAVLLKRALNASPSRRHPSVLDLVERLERAASGF